MRRVQAPTSFLSERPDDLMSSSKSMGTNFPGWSSAEPLMRF